MFKRILSETEINNLSDEEFADYLGNLAETNQHGARSPNFLATRARIGQKTFVGLRAEGVFLLVLFTVIFSVH